MYVDPQVVDAIYEEISTTDDGPDSYTAILFNSGKILYCQESVDEAHRKLFFG